MTSKRIYVWVRVPHPIIRVLKYWVGTRSIRPRTIRWGYNVADMSGPPRFQDTGDFHFITFSCVGRTPLLQRPESRDVILEILERTRERWNWKIVAYVVMPEH